MDTNRDITKCSTGLDGLLTKNNISLFVMYIAAFTVITKPSLTIITGPVMAAVMLMLFLSEKFYCVIVLVVLINDGLATVVMGKGSFYWLLIALVILKTISNRNGPLLSNKELLHIGIVLLILFQFWLYNRMSSRAVFQALIYIIFLILTWYEIKQDEEKVKDFFFNIALTIFIIALSSLIFGGVMLTEGSIARYGIVGIGSGDPNFSSLLLNSGIAIMLAQKHKKRVVRIIMILVMMAAVLQTISITGLLCLIALMLVYCLAGLKLSKAVRNIFIVFMLAIIAFQSYNLLPLSFQNDSIDSYVFRIEEKLNAFSNKDYARVTTYRSSRTQENLMYFTNQPVLKKAFGGNSTPPKGVMLSHNTYVDLLLRFGIIGAAAFGFFIIRKAGKSFAKYYRAKTNGEIFLLKVVFLFYSSALSIYSGNEFAMWYMFLIVL